MKSTLTKKLLESHLVKGVLRKGEEIGLSIDQTLTQDATGTMVYLEFESLGLKRVKPEIAASYIDHNIIQGDFKNADDHRFLTTCASKFGVNLSPPGNGVSHHIHRQRFGVPGKTLLGSDSHTTTGGCLGMLSMGAGGVEVALAMAGKPYYLTTPEVWGCYLSGSLPPWVTGKDLILHLLGRFSVKGGIGKIMEFFGPGLASLKIADRAMVANMSVDMGLTAAVFPSDEETRDYLVRNGRGEAWVPLSSDENAEYDILTEVNLDKLEPLAACPHMPDNVKPVYELKDISVQQVIIGSSASGGYRDLMSAAEIVSGKSKFPNLDFSINPPSRQDLQNVIEMGGLTKLIMAGARICESGCLGCIGMGQAPASGSVSLRTFPRNFKGRSGTQDASVYLCSAETAAASALTGKITDPRTLGDPPQINFPVHFSFGADWIQRPAEDPEKITIIRGPNILPFPVFGKLEEDLDAAVILKVGDNISTDHIMPAGTRVLPFRSNIPKISEFVFDLVDSSFAARAREAKNGVVVGGENYGQGSSREHAALAPRYLGIRAKIVKSFARIHKANLINFGILPLIFNDKEDYDLIKQGDRIEIPKVRSQLKEEKELIVVIVNGKEILTRLEISSRHRAILLQGGLLNHKK